MKNLNYGYLLAGIMGVVLIIMTSIHSNQIKGWKDEVNKEIKLKNALLDTITYKTNKFKEEVAERLTLQGKISDVTNDNNKLSKSQIELMNRVKEVEKEKSIINAALIETKLKLDSMGKATLKIDTTKNTLTFSDSTKDLKYRLLITNVRPFKEFKPDLLFQDFEMTNKQFIEFHWGDKANNYPISFSISNSNKYFKINDIQSYSIPQLDKKKIDPNTWEKFKNWTNKAGGKITVFGIGFGVAASLFFLKVL